MKSIFNVFLIVISSIPAFATTYTFHTLGNWTEASNWDVYPGTTIAESDKVIINADLIQNTSVTIDGDIIINSSKSFNSSGVLTVNGNLINNGTFDNNSQLNLFGDCVNNGDWTNFDSGTLIVTANSNFSSYGNLINSGSILGYNSSHIKINGSFINNDNMTLNSTFEINLDANIQFTNNGFCQLNGNVRLEGEFNNGISGTFKINPSAVFIITDNSKLVNSGTINIDGECQLSSQITSDSTLGYMKVKGDLKAVKSIPEML